LTLDYGRPGRDLFPVRAVFVFVSPEWVEHG